MHAPHYLSSVGHKVYSVTETFIPAFLVVSLFSLTFAVKSDIFTGNNWSTTMQLANEDIFVLWLKFSF